MPPHGKKRANYLHGSHPVQRGRDGGKLGTPIIKQHTADRHYALATIGLYTYVTADGEYFNTPYLVDTQAYKWAAANKLISRNMLLGRNQRSWPVELTEDGKRVLGVWNAEHGEIDALSVWDGVEAWEGNDE
jgi:hypothetical protein